MESPRKQVSYMVDTIYGTTSKYAQFHIIITLIVNLYIKISIPDIVSITFYTVFRSQRQFATGAFY